MTTVESMNALLGHLRALRHDSQQEYAKDWTIFTCSLCNRIQTALAPFPNDIELFEKHIASKVLLFIETGMDVSEHIYMIKQMSKEAQEIIHQYASAVLIPEEPLNNETRGLAAMYMTLVCYNDSMASDFMENAQEIFDKCKSFFNNCLEFGMHIKLRHKLTGKKLHSHRQNYPKGSKQQQVTGLDEPDNDEDWWKIKPRHAYDGCICEGQIVKNGDIIRLEHVATSGNLHSHFVPLFCNPSQHEVSVYGHNNRGNQEDDWRVECADQLHMNQPFRLVHVLSNHTLHSHNIDYPFGQQEITCFNDRDDNDFWSVCAATNAMSNQFIPGKTTLLQAMHDNVAWTDLYVFIRPKYALLKRIKPKQDIPCIVKIKTPRAVPKKVKILCWNTHVGEDIGIVQCFCCKSSKISQMDFHCGHVVSKANGGKATVPNLRPICAACNLSMGTRDMREFADTHGFGAIAGEH